MSYYVRRQFRSVSNFANYCCAENRYGAKMNNFGELRFPLLISDPSIAATRNLTEYQIIK